MSEETPTKIDATQATIREFILSKFPIARSHKMTDEESLLDRGIIDSLGVLEIVGFLEKQFGITLTDEEMVADHFDSITSIARFVRQKLGNE